MLIRAAPLLFLLVFVPLEGLAHGERAMQATTRMRTINWYDVKIGPPTVAIGEVVKIKGRLRVSSYWPEQIPSVEDRVFLNVSTGGPNFVRVSSNIDGISAVQSTSLEQGKDYSFAIELKARKPGRFHVHPVLNVKDAGTLAGPGRWVEVSGSFDDFENKVETMFGREVDLERFNLGTIAAWHLIWIVIGGAWLFYWLRQRPLLVPRLRAVTEAENKGGDGDDLITDGDVKVAVGFITVTLLIIVAGFMWGERAAPVTIPLRTSKISIPADKPYPVSKVNVQVEKATYRIPGRSFRMELLVMNNGPATLYVGEFMTANIRFINPAVRTVTPLDEHDLIASAGLRVVNDGIAPGETKSVEVFAEDALWETQRLTRMINDPDSVIAGLLFFYGDDGSREIVEVAGSLIPVFE